MADESKVADVSTPTADYNEMESKRELCRVLGVGTGQYGAGDGSFLDNADKYLPRYSTEFKPDHEFRRDHLTVVPPELPDSVDAVVSSILNGPITLEDAPAELYDPEEKTGHWQNIDRQGRTGDAFSASLGSESVTEGQTGFFVDFYEPIDPEEARPYWVQIHPVDLIETDYKDGHLHRARWMEKVVVENPSNQWEHTSIERYRVLYRGDPSLTRESVERYARFETHIKNDKGKWVLVENDDPRFEDEKLNGYLTPPDRLSDDLAAEFIEIPLYLVPSGYKRPGVSWPPLRHQAALIRLWSLMHSDFSMAQHYAMNPRDVIKGVTEEEYHNYNPKTTPAGDGNLTFLPRNAEWDIQNHDGSSFSSVSDFLEALTAKIHTAGIETLRGPASGVELATLGLMHREQKLTRLEVISMFWAMAFQSGIRRTELLMGLEPQTTVVMPEPNKDLLIAPQARQQFLTQSAANDQIDVETYWKIGKTIIGVDIDEKEIAQRVAAQRQSMGPF